MNVFPCEGFQIDLQSLMHTGLKRITAVGRLWEMKTIKGFISSLDSQMCWPKYAEPVIYQFGLSSYFQAIEKHTAVPTSSLMSCVCSANDWGKDHSVLSAHKLATFSQAPWSVTLSGLIPDSMAVIHWILSSEYLEMQLEEQPESLSQPAKLLRICPPQEPYALVITGAALLDSLSLTSLTKVITEYQSSQEPRN